MRKNDHPFLIQHCLPNLIKLQGAKVINDDLEITADVELVHLQLGPTLTQTLAELLVGSINEGIIVELSKKSFSGACQP